MRLGAETDAADRDRQGAFRKKNAEMHRREAAHGQADDMSLLDTQVIENLLGVVGSAPLAVHLHVVWHLRGRITARIEGDAAVSPAEVADLQLPCAGVAG